MVNNECLNGGFILSYEHNYSLLLVSQDTTKRLVTLRELNTIVPLQCNQLKIPLLSQRQLGV